MRIHTIDVKDVLPIKRFHAEELSDVVVLAGRNGVGKTRLMTTIIGTFRNPSDPKVRLVVESTSEEEGAAWGSRVLDTRSPADAAKLQQTLQTNRRRAGWKSSVMQIESDRSIERIDSYGFSWDIADPWEEVIGWDQTFGRLRDRFNDTIHSLLRKMQSRRNEIAKRAEALMAAGRHEMPLDFPDPLAQFKKAFSQLLSPKELIDPDPRTQSISYRVDGQTFPLQSLSSGEREVVNIVFDFLLRAPDHCIVFFDEPELHLHPELSYKLLQTLQSVAGRNQFVFCTHSPDIITASLEHSVVFVAPAVGERNQAIVVRETDETNAALKHLGQSVGIIALGKKIVLIEGGHASLDKQTYGAILQNDHPDLVLVPSEGKEVITSFRLLHERVLQRSIWGVEFFMLCDRDAVPQGGDAGNVEAEENGRLRILDRYHLENFFLDEHMLASVFREIEEEASWLRSPTKIREVLIEEARSLLSYATALYVAADLRRSAGNVDVMPKDCHGKSLEDLVALVVARAAREKDRVADVLENSIVETAVQRAHSRLETSLTDGDTWKTLIPGKPLLAKFAGRARIDVGRLKRSYIKQSAGSASDPFLPIRRIFAAFSSMSGAGGA